MRVNRKSNIRWEHLQNLYLQKKLFVPKINSTVKTTVTFWSNGFRVPNRATVCSLYRVNCLSDNKIRNYVQEWNRIVASISCIDDIPPFGYVRASDILMLRLAGAINKPTIPWNERDASCTELLPSVIN